MNFTVINLGCKVNRVESDDIAAALLSCGCEQVTDQADVAVVNTCTVTGEAEKKTRKAIRAALRNNPRAKVYVIGCAAAINPQELLAIDERVKICAKHKVIDEIYSEEARCKKGTDLLLDDTGKTSVRRTGESFPTRVGVKIQDGCDNACTFCIVHVARGKAHSRPRTEIIEEIKGLAASGVNEIVLTGINLGSYRDGSYTLEHLLSDLLQKTEQVRFRLSSIEPKDVSSPLLELIAQSQGRICRHFHLPLQSGSSKVLTDMARLYDRNFYRNLVRSIYEHIPEFSLSTDVIVGFPGESDDDFNDTLSLVEESRFSKVHIFPYSPRKGTPAAVRTDHVDPVVKASRVRQLTTLADELRKQDYRKRQGTEELVLVEQQGTGTTESYHTIPIPETIPAGTLVALPLPPV